MPRTPEQAREENYRSRYGITTATYEAMLAEQQGVCRLCGSPPKNRRLSVDHDHDSGVVRDLLCHNCNRALAHFENPVWYAAALDYLKRHHPSRFQD